jgi:hypothetical protein
LSAVLPLAMKLRTWLSATPASTWLIVHRPRPHFRMDYPSCPQRAGVRYQKFLSFIPIRSPAR